MSFRLGNAMLTLFTAKRELDSGCDLSTSNFGVLSPETCEQKNLIVKTHAPRALQYRARYMWRQRHSNTWTWLALGITFWLLSDPKLWKLCLSSLSIKLILGWNRKTLKVPPSQPTARASPAAFHVALVTTSSPRATHSAEPLMVFTMRILPLIAPLATMWPNSGWNFKEHTRSSCAIARSSVPRSCLWTMHVCNMWLTNVAKSRSYFPILSAVLLTRLLIPDMCLGECTPCHHRNLPPVSLHSYSRPHRRGETQLSKQHCTSPPSPKQSTEREHRLNSKASVMR